MAEHQPSQAAGNAPSAQPSHSNQSAPHSNNRHRHKYRHHKRHKHGTASESDQTPTDAASAGQKGESARVLASVTESQNEPQGAQPQSTQQGGQPRAEREHRDQAHSKHHHRDKQQRREAGHHQQNKPHNAPRGEHKSEPKSEHKGELRGERAERSERGDRAESGEHLPQKLQEGQQGGQQESQQEPNQGTVQTSNQEPREPQSKHQAQERAPHGSRHEARHEGKGHKREEWRGEKRDGKHEGKHESKQYDRSESKHEPQPDAGNKENRPDRADRPSRHERRVEGRDTRSSRFDGRPDARLEEGGATRPDARAEGRTDARTEGRTDTRPDARHAGRSDSPISAYYTRRAMFSDYGQGGYEDDEEPATKEEKEELVFPPAQTIGAPGMNLEQPNLYTGARGAAIRILSRVERSDTYLDRALEHELEHSDLNALDRALLTELVHGVLRWQSKLDWVLTGFYHGEFVKCITPVKNAMRIALYQVMFLTKIPPFAAVNESVELIKRLKGARSANLVNAVLRNILHNINNIRYPIREQDPTRHLSIMYGHPSWLVRRWLHRFGEEQTELLLKTNNERPKVALRLSPLQGSREDLVKYLDEQQIKQWESPYDERFILVGSLSAVREWESFQGGWFSVQDPSAALVVRLASPQAGQTVLDLCAAPGGKATFAAELMLNQGRVIALDKYDGKLDTVRENAARLRLSCIETRSADARTVTPFEALSTIAAQEQSQREQIAREQAVRAEQERRDGKNKKNRRDKNEKFFERREEKPVIKTISPEELADVVFVDAPCSGTGTLSKKPDIRWKLDTDSFPALTKLQRDILRNAAELVKVGGTLVYSTCTIEPEENTGTAAWFLEHFPNFALEPAEQYLPEAVCKDGFMQTFPHIHKTDGAFAARFVRKA